jgi:hypothetical protein
MMQFGSLGSTDKFHALCAKFTFDSQIPVRERMLLKLLEKRLVARSLLPAQIEGKKRPSPLTQERRFEKNESIRMIFLGRKV